MKFKDAYKKVQDEVHSATGETLGSIGSQAVDTGASAAGAVVAHKLYKGPKMKKTFFGDTKMTSKYSKALDKGVETAGKVAAPLSHAIGQRLDKPEGASHSEHVSYQNQKIKELESKRQAELAKNKNKPHLHDAINARYDNYVGQRKKEIAKHTAK